MSMPRSDHETDAATRRVAWIVAVLSICLSVLTIVTITAWTSETNRVS